MAWVGCALSLVALALLSPSASRSSEAADIATRRRSLGGQDGVEVLVGRAEQRRRHAGEARGDRAPGAALRTGDGDEAGRASRSPSSPASCTASSSCRARWTPTTASGATPRRRAPPPPPAACSRACAHVCAVPRQTAFWAAVFFYAAYFGLLRVRSRDSGARRTPLPTGEAVAPAILSGMIWACAGLGAMLAMDGLGFGVGYMLCTNATRSSSTARGASATTARSPGVATSRSSAAPSPSTSPPRPSSPSTARSLGDVGARQRRPRERRRGARRRDSPER